MIDYIFRKKEIEVISSKLDEYTEELREDEEEEGSDDEKEKAAIVHFKLKQTGGRGKRKTEAHSDAKNKTSNK
jgi:hypothetical protein